MTITPVQLAGNEIYEILKKRLIDEMPDERVLSDVAREYVQQIKKAEDGGYITATGIAKDVRKGTATGSKSLRRFEKLTRSIRPSNT